MASGALKIREGRETRLQLLLYSLEAMISYIHNRTTILHGIAMHRTGGCVPLCRTWIGEHSEPSPFGVTFPLGYAWAWKSNVCSPKISDFQPDLQQDISPSCFDLTRTMLRDWQRLAPFLSNNPQFPPTDYVAGPSSQSGVRLAGAFLKVAPGSSRVKGGWSVKGYIKLRRFISCRHGVWQLPDTVGHAPGSLPPRVLWYGKARAGIGIVQSRNTEDGVEVLWRH